jgi:hypothetical protein
MMTAPQVVRVVGILKLAFTASVVIYGVVAFVAPRADPSWTGGPRAFLALFGGLAALALINGIVLPRIMLTAPRLLAAATNEAQPGPPRDRLARALMAACIVRLALFEAVAVAGLALGLLGSQPMLFVPFGIAALGAIATVRLREPDVDALLATVTP